MLEKWLRLNARIRRNGLAKHYDEKAALTPNLSTQMGGKPDKFQYFSPNPGAGDADAARIVISFGRDTGRRSRHHPSAPWHDSSRSPSAPRRTIGHSGL